MQYFKKGSIVPRRLGVILAQHKKAQHWIVFGVDVQFDGTNITPVKPMGEKDYLIRVPHKISAPRKNGTRQHSGFYMPGKWSLSHSSDTRKGEYSASMHKS